ncbi:hypothetical protein DYB35_008959 [Aphanomyces astaci]|uniref:diacylglycerol O-acyltransferase n=1 Tax=Aphanomyces astaci TaxID=112090 RepID=A0A3R7EH45_APHAT|nr:hypothetical protein DYB35_008959 [Aphanomyces astaci]
MGLFLFYSSWLGSIGFFIASLAALAIYPPSRVPLALFYGVYGGALYLLPWGTWTRFCDCVRWFNENSVPYFQGQKLVFDDGVTPCAAKSKSLLSFHPHGVLVCGCAVRWLATDLLFVLPVIAQIMYWAGGGPANRSSFEMLAKEGTNIGLLPGGFEEASLFTYKKHRVFLKNRKGFIKLGLQYGYKVHPVYTFGEEDTFWTLPYFASLRLFLNQYKIPTVVFWGQWWCPFMPHPSAKLVTVVGPPLALPLTPSPTKEDVDKYHALYLDALQTLFDKFKAEYASTPDATLEIW